MTPQDRLKTMPLGDKLIGGGLVVFFISLFLPWYSVSYDPGFGVSKVNISAHIFDAFWGDLAFLFFLVALAFFVVRIAAPQMKVSLPVADWLIFAVAGALMAVCTLLWWLVAAPSSNFLSGSGYSAGVSFGLFIALIGSILIAVGGALRRAEGPAMTGRSLSFGSGGGQPAGYVPPGQQGYVPPQQGYAPPPQQGYAPPPQQGYAPPPQQGYAPPPSQPEYGAPQPGFGAPQPGYGAPQPGYPQPHDPNFPPPPPPGQ